MKSALVHAALLLVMLVYGYHTWTREKVETAAQFGDVVLWSQAETDLASITYQTEKKSVKLERRGTGADAYWWGIETKTEPKPKPLPPLPPPPGADDKGKPGAKGKAGAPIPQLGKGPGAGTPATPPGGHAGHGHPAPALLTEAMLAQAAPGTAKAPSAPGPNAAPAHGTAPSAPATAATPAAPPAPVADVPVPEETITTTREFPVSEETVTLAKNWSNARAQRSFGTLTDAQKKEYKLDNTTVSITIVSKAGTRSFIVGGTVYGGADKYVLDTESGNGYVLGGKMLSSLEGGEGALRLQDPRGFKDDDVEAVTIAATGKQKNVKRLTTQDEKGQSTKTWAVGDKPDQTAANFIDSISKLKPMNYDAKLAVSELTAIGTLTYTGKTGRLGTLSLYKRDVPADPASPPSTDTNKAPAAKIEYYLVTEKTRVPGLLLKSVAERAETDLATVLADAK